MTPIVGGTAWHDDDMSLADADLVVATGAAVRLDRFVGLDASNLRFAVACVIGKLVVGHVTVDVSAAEEGPADERDDHDEGRGNDHHVAAVLHRRPERVVAHGPYGSGAVR
jgi:hypothetical protein